MMKPLAAIPEWDAFIKQGLPTKQNERFKYTDFGFLRDQSFSLAQASEIDDVEDVLNQHRLRHENAILLVEINGLFVAELSDIAKLPQELIICSLSEARKNYSELLAHHELETIDANQYPFASINSNLSNAGLFVHIADHFQLTQPLHLLSLVMDSTEFMAHTKRIIVLGKQSHLTLVEEYFSTQEQKYLMNVVNTIAVGPAAHYEHYKIQQEGKRAIHMAHHFVEQKRDSAMRFTHFSFGNLFARDDVIVKLQEAGASCETSGFYRVEQDNQYVDHHVDIYHLAPHTQSEMLYKGIADNKSRAVFNGKLQVQKAAQKILAHQENHNLLLSNQAAVYSKPELEIYADDVKCKHGSSTGQLDEDAIFYLQSRGIERSAAINMLLQGFADVILQRVKHVGIKMRIEERL